MRGRRRVAALRVLGELQDRGCEAGGYRLTGEHLEHVCCRHLYGSDRLLTVWPEPERVVVILVGPHSNATGDVYDQVLDALGLETPDDEREKPACCDEEGSPPTDVEAAETIADAVESRARQARRRR